MGIFGVVGGDEPHGYRRRRRASFCLWFERGRGGLVFARVCYCPAI